jgi:hypothetical protein
MVVALFRHCYLVAGDDSLRARSCAVDDGHDHFALHAHDGNCCYAFVWPIFANPPPIDRPPLDPPDGHGRCG